MLLLSNYSNSLHENARYVPNRLSKYTCFFQKVCLRAKVQDIPVAGVTCDLTCLSSTVIHT